MKGHVAEGLPLARREDDRAVLAKAPDLLQYLERASGQGDPVLPTGLHAGSGNGPRRGLDVHVSPFHETYLARPGGGEDQKLQRQPCHRVRGRCAEGPHEVGQLRVGHGRVVCLGAALPGEGLRY